MNTFVGTHQLSVSLTHTHCQTLDFPGVYPMSHLALGGQLAEGSHNVAEAGPVLGAGRPAAYHELVHSGGAALRQGQLPFGLPQLWRNGERGDG